MAGSAAKLGSRIILGAPPFGLCWQLVEGNHASVAVAEHI